jgi:hypothetical protein
MKVNHPGESDVEFDNAFEELDETLRVAKSLRGSDLDVFEAIGEKSAVRTSRASSHGSVPPPPPPPPTVRSIALPKTPVKPHAPREPLAPPSPTSLGISTPFAWPLPSRSGVAPEEERVVVPAPIVPAFGASAGASSAPPRSASPPASPWQSPACPAPMFPPSSPSVVRSSLVPAPPQQAKLPMTAPPRLHAPARAATLRRPASARPPPSPLLSPLQLQPLKPARPLPPTAIASRIEPAPPPHQDRSRMPLRLGWGVAAAASLVLAVVLCSAPRAGQLAVNVADLKGASISHLLIYVDGNIKCDSAPCVVSDVAAGSHTVKVKATGFEPAAEKAVAIEPRRNTTVDFSLALLPNGGTGIRVTGTQAGVELFVDDKEIGPLPQELHNMAPGSHKVKIAGSDRYAPVEKVVTISKDELQDLGPVTLKVVKGRATFTRETPGVRLFILSGTDRWEVPTLPVSVDLDTSRQWSLVASEPGFNDYSEPISFDDGQAEKAFTVALETKMAPVALDSLGPAPSSPLPYAVAAASPAPAPVAPSPRAASNDAAVAAIGPAFLKINSLPASSVVLDGKPIGSTPKLKYRVSSGTHSLMFVNLDKGFKKQMLVRVSAGETKAAIYRN